MLEALSRCELFGWRGSPAGRLAEIIVLAQELVWRGDDAQLSVPQRRFAYMPYMHSESVAIHQEALRLFAQPGLENNLDFERRHLAIHGSLRVSRSGGADLSLGGLRR